MKIVEAIKKVAEGEDLSRDEITSVFGSIMEGKATPAQIGGLLIGLRTKGETPDEIAGAAAAMRGKATRLKCPEPDKAVDTCGTGGDGASTVNLSTLAALVVAGAGVRVAKHGNRAVSSKSGSADVLEALGMKLDAPIAVLEECLQEHNICFLFAPSFHAATRHASAPRKELGTRTIFNLLGPLTNPAGVKNQLVGVFHPGFCEPAARALGQLGARRAFVVHGHGGLDEIAVDGPTRVAEWFEGKVRVFELAPSDFGVEPADAAGLAGGDPVFNAQAIRDVLAGKKGAVRTATLLGAGAALWVAGAANDAKAGAQMAAEAIDSGKAAATLDALVKRTQAS